MRGAAAPASIVRGCCSVARVSAVLCLSVAAAGQPAELPAGQCRGRRLASPAGGSLNLWVQKAPELHSLDILPGLPWLHQRAGHQAAGERLPAQVGAPPAVGHSPAGAAAGPALHVCLRLRQACAPGRPGAAEVVQGSRIAALAWARLTQVPTCVSCRPSQWATALAMPSPAARHARRQLRHGARGVSAGISSGRRSDQHQAALRCMQQAPARTRPAAQPTHRARALQGGQPRSAPSSGSTRRRRRPSFWRCPCTRTGSAATRRAPRCSS